MEIIAKDLTNTPEAKRKRMTLLLSLWVWGFIALFINNYSGFGVLATAAIFTIISLVSREEPIRINLNESGLSITKGQAYLWGAALTELEGAEIMQQSKRMGVVFSPMRMVFRKNDGDSFSVPLESFNEKDVNQLILEIQHNTSFRYGDAR